ncbi:MAG: 5'-methylthioadenosine/adenosylhomocysteine nucleosidase [Firmicutes bacterium]|nr:5'-methylthioadenosine/adenosylhomocysteine nucleosidase [Bacillota bacterium]
MKLQNIGIIGAMEEEIALLRQKASIIDTEQIIGVTFYKGTLYDKKVVLVKSGIGKVNAALCAQILIDRFAVDCIINVGVAGAVYKELSIGDIVISKDAVQHDMDTSVFGDPIGIIPRMEESYFKADKTLIELAEKCSMSLTSKAKVFLGRIASGDQFISTPQGKERIWQTVQGYCAEMEGAAIAHTCYLNQIPFVIIRSISDDAEDKAHIAYEQFVKIAAANSSELLEKMFEMMS